MSAFSDAVQDFFAGLAGLPGGEFNDRVNAVLQAAAKATPDEATWAVGPLTEVVARAPDPRISVLGVVGGLLTRGVNFWGVLPHYLAGVRHHLAQAAEAERAIRPLLPPGRRLADLPPEERQTLYENLPEPAKSRGMSLYLLDYLLANALPILGQVKPCRQLARAMGFDAGWLRDAGVGPDWLAQLPRVLEDNAAADGPLPDPRAAIDAALSNLRQVTLRPPQKDDAVRLALRPLFEATTFVPPEEFGRAAAELARTAAAADPAWAGELAGVCGGFIERGADPEAGADALVAGLPRLLDPTTAFVKACRARAADGEESPVATHAAAVALDMPAEKKAFDAVRSYCLGTIAHLARSPAARKRHGHNPELLAKLDAVRWDAGNAGFLWKMLQVLDGEELVILAPAFRLGWRVKVGGIGDNFQLHALIGGHLVGRPEDGKYPGAVGTHDQRPQPARGVPLSPRAVATVTNAPCTGREPGFFSGIQLWNWTALQKDGTLPANAVAAHEHFVWNEGVPADVVPFEGTRVILLGDSTIIRNWNGGRIFPFMRASFEVVETMAPDAAGAWLGKMAAVAGRGG